MNLAKHQRDVVSAKKDLSVVLLQSQAKFFKKWTIHSGVVILIILKSKPFDWTVSNVFRRSSKIAPTAILLL